MASRGQQWALRKACGPGSRKLFSLSASGEMMSALQRNVRPTVFCKLLLIHELGPWDSFQTGPLVSVCKRSGPNLVLAAESQTASKPEVNFSTFSVYSGIREWTHSDTVIFQCHLFKPKSIYIFNGGGGVDFKDIKIYSYSEQTTLFNFYKKWNYIFWGVNPVTWEIASLKFKFPHAKN